MLKLTQNLINYQFIDNNLIKIGNQVKMFIKVSGINIGNYSCSEYHNIMFLFGDVLNMFPHNVQIYCSTSKFDNWDISTISTNKKIIEYCQSYNEFLSEIISGQCKKDFYIILSRHEKLGLNNIKSSYGSIFNYINNVFSIINIKTEILNRNAIRNLLNTSNIAFSKNHVKIGKEFIKIFVIKEYPNLVRYDWIEKIVSINIPMIISYHIYPQDITEIIKSMKINIAKLESSQSILIKSGFGESHEITKSLEDANDLLDRLITCKDKMFMLGFYIGVKGNSLEELEVNVNTFKNIINSIQLQYRNVRFSELVNGLKSILPICDDRLFDIYNFDTTSLSSFFPFVNNDFFDKENIFYGINLRNKTLITLNRFQLENYNMIILGTTGSGKSMFVKLEICKHLMAGIKTIVIDHLREYGGICRLLNGSYGENPDWENDLIVLGGDKLKALQKAWNYIKVSNPKQRKILVVDEFWELIMLNPKLVVDIIKQIRHYNCGITCITQNVADFLGSKYGRIVYDNCACKLLLKLGETDLEEATRIYNLTRSEKKFLGSARQGRGLLIWNSNRVEIETPCSLADLEIFTTSKF